MHKHIFTCMLGYSTIPATDTVSWTASRGSSCHNKCPSHCIPKHPWSTETRKKRKRFKEIKARVHMGLNVVCVCDSHGPTSTQRSWVTGVQGCIPETQTSRLWSYTSTSPWSPASDTQRHTRTWLIGTNSVFDAEFRSVEVCSPARRVYFQWVNTNLDVPAEKMSRNKSVHFVLLTKK